MGVVLAPFEQELHVMHEMKQRVVDGYAEPILEDKVKFRGVILPRKTLKFTELGFHNQEGTFLYIRLSQTPLPPEIRTNDIVYTTSGSKWRVMNELDYSAHGEFKIFDVQKVT